MTNNTNELSINELEDVSGGICGVAVATCVVTAVTAALKNTDFVYDIVTNKK